MKFRVIPQTDLILSEVGFGLWTVATPQWGVVDDLMAERLLRQAYDNGITYFEATATAAPENAEVRLAKAFDSSLRQKIVIGTGFICRPSWSSLSVEKACEESLKRLGVTTIDLYHLWNPPAQSLVNGDVDRLFKRLKLKGKIKCGGIAVPPEYHWTCDAKAALLDSSIPIVQMPCNFFMRDSFQALSSTMDRLPDRKTAFVVRDPQFFGLPNDDFRQEQLEKIQFLWEETGRTAAQAAIQFSLNKPSVCSVLPDLATAESIKECSTAPMSPPLTEKEFEILESLGSELVCFR